MCFYWFFYGSDNDRTIYFLETAYEHSCYKMISEITLKDELSTVNIECIGTQSCEYSIFIIDTPSLNKNADNNILSNSNIQRINMICTGFESCSDGILTIIGLNNFELNCSHTRACNDFALTLLSLDHMDTNDTSTLTLNCNGNYNCDDVLLDGSTLNNINVNCLNGTMPCDNMQVRCLHIEFVSQYIYCTIYHIIYSDQLSYQSFWKNNK